MATPTLEIVSPGLLTTVQDLGRFGYQRYGIPVCGALDSVSLRIANILVGNRDHLAGLEITAIGPTIRFAADTTIAVVGADLEPTLAGVPNARLGVGQRSGRLSIEFRSSERRSEGISRRRGRN